MDKNNEIWEPKKPKKNTILNCPMMVTGGRMADI